MKNPLIFTLVFVLSISACHSGGGDGNSTATAAGPAATTPKAATGEQLGSSTGGGSLGRESGLTLMHWAADELAQEILNSSPEIYRGLPPGWTPQRLADAIKNVEPTLQDVHSYVIPEVSRYHDRLMFDHPRRADGTQYLSATRYFIERYAAYEVNSRTKQSFFVTIQEIKLKLAHEAAHLMDIGISEETDISEARAFAHSLLTALESDNVECLPTSPPPKDIYTVLEKIPLLSFDSRQPEVYAKKLEDYFAHTTRAYVFNRPTGKAAVPSNVVRQCPDHKEEPDQCSMGYYDVDTSPSISWRLANGEDHHFDLRAIKRSIHEGRRDYGESRNSGEIPDYFLWSRIDSRKAVPSEQGYHSDFKYSYEIGGGNFFSYLDFMVTQSSAAHLEIETYPPPQQENWQFSHSEGRAKIRMDFRAGQPVNAELLVINSFNELYDKKRPAVPVNLTLPLTCVRSFNPILPANRPVDIN